MYFEATFLFAIGQRWPRVRCYFGPIGVSIIVVALIASSFSTHVWHLILTQGILYGIGGGILYAPVLMFIDEWFVKRKGLALGVMQVSDTQMCPTWLPACVGWPNLMRLLGRGGHVRCGSPLCTGLGIESIFVSHYATCMGRRQSPRLRSSPLFHQTSAPCPS